MTEIACSYPWLLIFPMQSSSHHHFLSSFLGSCCVVIGPLPKPHTVFSSVVTNLLFTLFEWLFMHHIEVCCEYNKSRVHMITCCLHHCTVLVLVVCTVTCLISFRLTPNINNQGSKMLLPLAHHFSNHNGRSEDKRIADQVENTNTVEVDGSDPQWQWQEKLNDMLHRDSLYILCRLFEWLVLLLDHFSPLHWIKCTPVKAEPSHNSPTSSITPFYIKNHMHPQTQNTTPQAQPVTELEPVQIHDYPLKSFLNYLSLFCATGIHH